jgi:2-polyprenyl-3-methyl-5-hydroxy-6-metoxy-1,4-benzoquinol methylase
LYRNVPRHGTSEPSRFSIFRCRDCHLKQTRPLPTIDELQQAYGHAYTWRTSTGLVASAEGVYRRLLVRADQARATRRATELAGGTRLLDVGCGDGLLVTEARRIGMQAFGVDRPGAPLWPGCDPSWRQVADIETMDRSGEEWDVISLLHVAEHLRDPLTVFRRVHDWLTSRGILLLQVPNAGSLQARLLRARWFGYDIPRHLVHWDVATLRLALKKTGFGVLETRHMSWRDSGPLWINSLFADLDPLVDRERALDGQRPTALATMCRRLIYFGLVWGATPITLLEAAMNTGGTITVLAWKEP